MADSKHTPGPWAYRMSGEDCCDYEVFCGEGHSIDIIAGEYGIESEADARLIAAAPELLEMAIWAEAAIAPFSKEPAEKSGISRLRAAIAKATPSQS